MIITDLHATNFLKYATLDLPELPQRGVIAIAGANEAGKSSLGEMICFALFGRTYSLDQTQLEKLIRWGETHCSVRLCFRIDDSGHFEVARFLDRDGNQGARLNRVGEEQPLARGREAVASEMAELLGFGYDEFIESFYLAQREITTPHPHSHAVKAMAGITKLELVTDQYRAEIAEFGQRAGEMERQQQRLSSELSALAIDPLALPELQAESGAATVELEALELERGELEQTSQAYQAGFPEFRSASGALTRAKLLRFILLLLALVLVATWALIHYQPDAPQSLSLQRMLHAWMPAWSLQRLPWLLWAGAAAALLFLLAWIRVAAVRSRAERLRGVAAALVQRMEGVAGLGGTAEVQAQEDVDEGAQVDAVEEMVESEQAPSRFAFDDTLRELLPRVKGYAAEPDEVRSSVGGLLARLHQQSQQLQGRHGELEQQIRDERVRLQKAEELDRIDADMAANQRDYQRRIELRELGRELLTGAARHLSQRFNRDLRDLVGRTLPLFTEGRYEHLQIDDDLTVRAFSTEKRDFMNLEEISSGTQRQIMLALRLALSEELANKSVRGRQFLFLDEPFAFFDRLRTESSIRVLPELSDVITQIWVVAQEFPQQQNFERMLVCEREQTELSTSEAAG